MEELVDRSLERVMEFLDSQGLRDRLPTYTYVDSYSLHSKQALAQVPGELELLRTMNERSARVMSMKNLPEWYQRMGVCISEDSLSEYVENMILRFRKLSGLTNEAIEELRSYGTEILIFKSMKEFMDANPNTADMLVDSVLAHETWHVVEMRRGLLGADIIEGTAEYCRTEFEKWRRREKTAYNVPSCFDDDKGMDYLTDIATKFLYRKGLEIVRKNVVSLPEVLIPETRARMDKELMDYVDGWQKERNERNDISYEQRAAMARMVWPEFNVLDLGLTHENFLVALRVAGLEGMARELQDQDCSKLLNEYQKMGYGE